MGLFKRWWFKTTSIAVVAMLIGGGIALLSPRMSISTEGNFVSINLEYGITARAAITVTSLGHNQDKNATSPWTALTNLSLTADDRFIVCHAGDTDASGISLIVDDVSDTEYLGPSYINYAIYGSVFHGQSFTAESSFILKTVCIYGYKVGSPPDSLYVNIYAADDDDKPTGPSLASGLISAEDVNTSPSDWIRIIITPLSIVSSNKYVFILSSPSSIFAHSYRVSCDTTSPTYDGGMYLYSSDSGDNWVTNPEVDCLFKILIVGETVTLIKDVVAANAVNVVTSIWSGKSTYTHSAYYIVITNTSTAKAMTAYKASGLADSPLDKYQSATGSGNDASTGSTGTLSQADELVVAASGVEDEIDDPHGTWSGVTGNEQFDATNGGGDSSNIQAHSVAMVVSATTALTGVDAGHDNTDWAACIATYKMETGAEPNIENVGGDWGLGVVEENSTYWANGSEPSWPLTDGDAKWTVTNNSGASVDIYIKGTNFTGGTPGWTLAGTPGEDQVSLVAFKEGDGSGDGKTLTLNDQLFIDSLGDGADIDWEMKFLSATSHSNGDIKTATVTITAQLE